MSGDGLRRAAGDEWDATVPPLRERRGAGSAGARRLVLHLAHTPEIARIGERMQLGEHSHPLNRQWPLFPGGRLEDASISRCRHAEIRRLRGSSVEIRDVGSSNGTWVNGERITSCWRRLADGDVLRVGDTILMTRASRAEVVDVDIPELLGTSEPMRALRGEIGTIAPSRLPVLVVGETGVGKELVARAVGRLGRPGARFEAINLSVTPTSLLASELFGHCKGAFTHAGGARHGVFRRANRGTILLDEIGELPAEHQAALLRVIECGQVHPVGGDSAQAVDVRVVAATNRDLYESVRSGGFRHDLHARLAGAILEVPPLRDRPEDVPLLALHFARRAGVGAPRFDGATLVHLMRRAWPSNVRRLKTVVERMVLDAPGADLLVMSDRQRLRLAREERELGAADPAGSLDRSAVERALEEASGNMTRAAKLVQRDRSHFYRIVKRLGIDPEAFRGCA